MNNHEQRPEAKIGHRLTEAKVVMAEKTVELVCRPRTIFRPIAWRIFTNYHDPKAFRLMSLTVDGRQQLDESMLALGISFAAFDGVTESLRCRTAQEEIVFRVRNVALSADTIEILVKGYEIE